MYIDIYTHTYISLFKQAFLSNICYSFCNEGLKLNVNECWVFILKAFLRK